MAQQRTVRIGPYTAERRPQGLVLRRGLSGARLLWWVGIGALVIAVALGMFEAGFIGFMAGMIGGTFMLIAGFFRGYIEMGDGVITRVWREIAVNLERRPTTYRQPPTPEELEIDGRTFPLESVRRVRIGHHVHQSQYGASHMYPVYLVLDREVFRVHDFDRQTPALALAQLLEKELGLEAEAADDIGPFKGPEGAGFYIVSTLAIVIGIAFPLGLSFASMENSVTTRVAYCLIVGAMTVGFAHLMRTVIVRVGRSAAREYAQRVFDVDL